MQTMEAYEGHDLTLVWMANRDIERHTRVVIPAATITLYVV